MTIRIKPRGTLRQNIFHVFCFYKEKLNLAHFIPSPLYFFQLNTWNFKNKILHFPAQKRSKRTKSYITVTHIFHFQSLWEPLTSRRPSLHRRNGCHHLQAQPDLHQRGETGEKSGTSCCDKQNIALTDFTVLEAACWTRTASSCGAPGTAGSSASAALRLCSS